LASFSLNDQKSNCCNGRPKASEDIYEQTRLVILNTSANIFV
jgi:hypothetical protein